MDDYWNLASTVGQTIYINSDLLASSGTDWWTISGVFFSTVTAIAGSFIAFMAFKLSSSEAKATRAHNRLSVKPILQFEFTQFKGVSDKLNKSFTLKLSNKGIGPAIINDVDFKINSTLIYQSIDGENIIASHHGKDFRALIESSMSSYKASVKAAVISKGSTFQANETLDVLHVEFDEISHEAFRAAINNVKFLVTYKSIYGEEMLPIKF